MLAVWNRKDAIPSGNGEGLPIRLSMQDNWDVEEFVSKVCMGRFLNHPAFKITLAVLIIGNALIIASRTETKVEEKYYGLFSAIDNIVLTVLTCEVLLNWYYGFWMYWKDGWNVINFFIVAYLCVGPFIPVLNNQKIFWALRVMRLMQVCMLVSGLARMIRVILQSIPDMANIMALLFVIMLVFSVFGVTLFGNLVPMHFGNLGISLYSLFICLTQDGWINIYKIFEEEGIALKIGGALYFFIFITGGAFICTNLLVAVVTSNLEQTMLAYSEEKQKRDQLLHPDKFVDRKFNVGDDNSSPELNLVHLKAVMQDTPMTHHQMPLISGNLGNLTEATCDDFCLILEGIQENLKRYKEIRDELSTIVKEVRSIAFNKEQEEERVLRNIQNTNISDGLLSNEVAAGRSGDILSTLMTLEKANMIDPQDVTSSGYHKGAVKMAFLKARRQSLLNQSVLP
ncbi:cation channel sperm-associated protein 4 isoform X2 [Trachemys scripta elegans]|uniref:cation channel sperm-associated protein 4 isoform X2 n=1 Tax=Trachemys scripta elegans TaxID=31138 RepID=UPI001554B536|nr:cation channel sperm-associated protein 4 isoform X2 [Trachemys scripta elegans]